jgi:hypothetical protein
VTNYEESISKILSKLEIQRKFLQIDLEPLRQQYDPSLYKLERAFQVLSEGKISAEKDYESLDNILKRLVNKYTTESNSPSTSSASSLIQELRQIIRDNPESIRHSRLATLKHTLDLLKWVFLLRSSSYSSESQSLGLDERALPNDEMETLFEGEDNTFDVQDHDEKTSALFDIENLFEDLFNDELSNDTIVDLKEVTEKPKGEFINRSWLESINHAIEKVIKATTNTPQESIEKIKIGVSKEWICRISIYGFNRNTNLAKIELALEIDWENQELNFHPSSDNQLENLDEVVSRFQNFNKEEDTFIGLRLRYTHPENTDFYNRELGFARAEPIRWETYGEIFKSPASGLSRFFVELNFGPSEYRSFRRPKSASKSSYNSGCLAALCITATVLLGLLFLIQQPGSLPPKDHSPSQKYLMTPQEQIYWEELHKAIPVWDLQTARRNLTPLSQSQNPCISEFSTALELNLNSKGASGFKDINQIKRILNEQRGCNLVITPYEFAP